MKNDKPIQYKGLLASNTEAVDEAAVKRTLDRIAELGGTLHFTIVKSEEGWHAQCNEVEGIMTGGKNPAPSGYEMEDSIRDAIHTAFHIPIRMSPQKLISSVSEMALTLN